MKNLFKGKKILIMGLGLHGGGVGVAKFFCKMGADVLVTDLKTEEKLKDSIEKLKGLKIKYTLGGHKEEDFISADLIIKNPDVPATSPYLEIARKNDVSIETDVSLFFKLAEAFTIGVTGTKGKSTTASLIYHILKQEYNRVFLAGNIGISPLEILPLIKKGDKVVLELSNFELEGLSQSPNIAVVTNIMPDHLNRYGTMEEYINSKKAIFKYQEKDDVLILNNDDLVVKEFAKETQSKVIFYSKAVKSANFKLFGEHNLYNLAAAIEVAKVLKISHENIEEALKTFNGVSSRQEFVGEIDGVKYFNDTTATMPDAVMAAIETFSETFPKAKLIFVCGGQNKGLRYEGLIRAIREKVNSLIILPGTASDILKAGLVDYTGIHDATSMQEAVQIANRMATAGDIVVLSPAAASFNLFKNEFDRGDQFVKAVKDLSK